LFFKKFPVALSGGSNENRDDPVAGKGVIEPWKL
jgi:hypothetical protein